MHIALATSKRLNNNIVNARPHQVHIDAHLIQMTAEGGEGPLEADIIILDGLILHEIFIFLINAIVGQMHELVRFGSLG